MRMPVDDLISNWAYMVMSALAWNLKSWYGLLMPNRANGSGVSQDGVPSVPACIGFPAQIVRSGRKSFIGSGLQQLAKDFFAAWENLRRMAPA